MKYVGYYNAFNRGASGNSTEAILLNGLATAQKYGWTSLEKSINGGIDFIANQYIHKGQNNLYLQKFDVEATNGLYSNQYMQNLTAPLSEASTTYNSYSGINGLFDESLVFIIPIYKNMPNTKVETPSNKNPNSYLKIIKVNGKEVDGFAYDKLNYNIEADTGVSSVKIEATSINNKASINGLGTIKLENGDNKISIKVTAENGNERVYIINVTVKELDPIEVTINKKKYTIVRKEGVIENIPENYEKSSIKIGEDDILCYKNTKTNNILIGLKDEKGEAKFYSYDEKTKKYTQFL